MDGQGERSDCGDEDSAAEVFKSLQQMGLGGAQVMVSAVETPEFQKVTTTTLPTVSYDAFDAFMKGGGDLVVEDGEVGEPSKA